MAKSTHKGTCQGCGAMQKLPNGVLSKHGYTVDWGFFNGVCGGANHAPFEESTDLIEGFIVSATEQKKRIEAEMAKLAEAVDPNDVWRYTYQNHKYFWEKRVLVLDGEYETFKTWKWVIKKGERKGSEKISHYGKSPDTIEEAVKFENARYIRHLERHITEIDNYIEWQEKRVAEWEPKPLIKL